MPALFLDTCPLLLFPISSLLLFTSSLIYLNHGRKLGGRGEDICKILGGSLEDTGMTLGGLLGESWEGYWEEVGRDTGRKLGGSWEDTGRIKGETF